MRTTLDIDDDVLTAAKELGKRTKKSAGSVISELARESLIRPTTSTAKESRPVYGFKTLPAAPGKIVTNELINRIREETGT
jgi:hypothetical protein